MVARCLVSGLVALALGLAFWSAAAAEDERDHLKVGMQTDGRILVPTNQVLRPAGTEVVFPGRPVDLAFAEGGKTLVVKNSNSLVFVDVATSKIKQVLRLRPVRAPNENTGFGVVGLLVQGERIYASDARDHVRLAYRLKDGRYHWGKHIELARPALGGVAHPAGMIAWTPQQLWVTSTRGNNVQLIDLADGVVKQTVRVGVAPYTLCQVGPDRLYVTNWGGNRPGKDDAQAKTSNTSIRIDPRTGVANDGTVSVLARMPGQWKEVKTIRVGLHPSGMAVSPTRRFLYVANANSDTVSVIDTHTDQVIETIRCQPEARLPFGSGPNALALSPAGDVLYVANGTNNCIAVIQLGRMAAEHVPAGRSSASRLAGLIPTGWYPGAVLVSADGKKLFVVNVKGRGSLSQPRPAAKGKNSHDYLGSICIIDVPDAEQLAHYTAEVNANNRLAYSLAGLDKPRPNISPVPVPQRHGEPSVFKHVLYIIKENRTYDQVFGDLSEGNGDRRLVMFGADVTPNHHALARQFTLFDNFYCSGVISADGHTWCNEAYVTDYLEKAFGEFSRSYPDDGSDPLAYAATGFLWDNALAHHKTFRDFGEYVRPDYAPKGTTWMQLYNDYKNGTHKVQVNVRPTIQRMARYTHPGYPWFPLITPDVYRARIFLKELVEYEKKGDMPNLLYLTLPCDHTEGTRPGYPTPRAMVADNDLALGRIVEAVSHSRFWPDTCIFVVEDDPQNGFDHVDAHRTVALVISQYTRRRFVDHTNYNQTGMVKTIELLLGLPPMNQLDLSATPMRHCFQAKPDLTPYTALPNQIALTEMNPNLHQLHGQALEWAKKSLALNLDEGDQADEDTLNRILWYATHGDRDPYPAQFAGAGEE